jgi:hypothetical protein
MKSSIALVVSLFLGLAGCSAATSPAVQTKAGSVAYQTQASDQSKVSSSLDDTYVDYRP